jgi:hypothetical protein
VIAAGPLLAKGAGLKSVAHPKEGCASVTATSLPPNGPITLRRERPSAECAGQIGSARGAETLPGAIERRAQADAGDLEDFPAMLAGAFRVHGHSTTSNRAVEIFACLRCYYGKVLPALRAVFLHLVLEAGPRTKSAVTTVSWDKELATSLARHGGAGRVTA